MGVYLHAFPALPLRKEPLALTVQEAGTDWVATGKFLPYRKSNVGRPSRHLRTGSRVMLRYGDANIRRPAGVALVEAWEGLWLLWRPPADLDAYRAFNQFGGQSLQHVGFQWGVHYLETSRGGEGLSNLISQFTYCIDTRTRLRGGRSCRSGIGRTQSLRRKDNHCCQHQDYFVSLQSNSN